jgi:hypothetical protein
MKFQRIREIALRGMAFASLFQSRLNNPPKLTLIVNTS